MKRNKQCPKCSSLRVGHVKTRVDEDPIAPRMVGVSSDVNAMGRIQEGDVSLLGKLEAYVCADCGFYESYVQEPQAVQWANIVGFSWVNEPPESEGAFR